MQTNMKVLWSFDEIQQKNIRLKVVFHLKNPWKILVKKLV